MKMTKNEKRAYWSKIVEHWKASGQTQNSYCRQHDIKPYLLTYWSQVSYAKEPLDTASKHKGFVPVQVAEHRHLGLTLRLSNGLQIEGVNTENLAIVRKIVGWSL